jgi:hypothetical protein
MIYLDTKCPGGPVIASHTQAVGDLVVHQDREGPVTVVEGTETVRNPDHSKGVGSGVPGGDD